MTWMLYRRDETGDFLKEFLAEIEVAKVFAYYLFDDERHTYCCEVFPSYGMRRVGHDFDPIGEDAAKEAWMRLEESYQQDEDFHYVHVSDIQRLRKESPHLFHESVKPECESLEESRYRESDPANAVWREQEEELCEYYAGNHPGWNEEATQ